MACVSFMKDYLDKDYLQNKENEYVIADYEVHKLQVLARLKHKVNHAISNNQPLFCIGFQLADFSLSDLNISKRFTEPVYFSGSQFFGYADFKETIFQERAVFSDACFQGGAQFSRAHFQEIVFFSRAKFEVKEATSIILSSTVKYTSQDTSMVKQNSIMYYLREKIRLSLT